MKYFKSLVILFLLSLLPACTTPDCEPCNEPSSKLTKAELKELSSKRSITLSNSLRQKLIADKDELQLTPEELIILKATGKVVLCGKCGYLLNSLKFKTYEKDHGGNMKQHVHPKTGFQADSLRKRMILTYDNWGTKKRKRMDHTED